MTPVLLIILDGFGHREPAPDNAIELADTPNWDRLWSSLPHTIIDASELHVGLPVRCRARDVSRSGFSAAFVGDPPTGHVFVAFDGRGPSAGWAALARIVRAAPLAAGRHLVAGRFLFAGG